VYADYNKHLFLGHPLYINWSSIYYKPVFTQKEILQLTLCKMGHIEILFHLKLLHNTLLKKGISSDNAETAKYVFTTLKELENGQLFIHNTQKEYIKRNPLPARGIMFTSKSPYRLWADIQ